MSLKSYLKFSVFTIIINVVSVFNLVFALWSIIYLIFSIFIVKNRDAEKVLKDKKILGFVQAFILCGFTFIFTVIGFALFPLTQHLVQTHLSNFYYLFLSLGIIGLISYYSLFIKLLIEAIKVVRQKEI